ncbi:hypothetical protein LX36DRAFT_419327 [Colletotrichum falcatum]|nr:hypothetical protein LX36DRAFT_419327 [Colletotrichum falcatum]
MLDSVTPTRPGGSEHLRSDKESSGYCFGPLDKPLHRAFCVVVIKASVTCRQERRIFGNKPQPSLTAKWLAPSALGTSRVSRPRGVISVF